MTNQPILVVDDEDAIRIVLQEGLAIYGYEVDTAPNADTAILTLEKKSYALALIDLKMPGSMNGLQLLAEIRRRWSSTQVVVMTGYATLDSAIVAIRQGAVDYLRKPVEIMEIVRCIQRNLPAKNGNSPGHAANQYRSGRDEFPMDDRFFHSPKLFIDRIKHRAALDKQDLNLTQVEFAILNFLATHSDRVIGAAELLNAAQGYAIAEADARPIVRVHIRHLRQKLNDDADTPSMILTVRGLGYRYIG